MLKDYTLGTTGIKIKVVVNDIIHCNILVAIISSHGNEIGLICFVFINLFNYICKIKPNDAVNELATTMKQTHKTGHTNNIIKATNNNSNI